MLAVSSSKSLRDRFILYGSRANAQNVNEKDATRNHLQEPRHGGVDIKNSSSKVLDYLSTLNVSHSWFFHFYLTAVLASLFWAAQFVMKGRILSSIATAQRQHLGPSMSINQVLLTWSMMAFQESRRLYESIVFFKQSSSKMWIGHWALGVGFFLTMSVAVWIEGSSTCCPAVCMQASSWNCRCNYSINDNAAYIRSTRLDILYWLVRVHPSLWHAVRLPSLSFITEEVLATITPDVPSFGMPSLLCGVHNLPVSGNGGGTPWIHSKQNHCIGFILHRRKSGLYS